MKIALVTPWFGVDTRGGAEDQARSLAQAIHKLGVDIEIWTTTARDSYHARTEHYYPAGLNEWNGLKIRRWAMEAPAMGVPPIIRKLAQQLKLRVPQHPTHEINLLGSLPNSSGLYQYIADHPERQCIFIPYPMGTSYWGSFLAQERAYHIPCLHDEPYAYYSTYQTMLRRASGVIFNSTPEHDLALRLYDLDPAKTSVAGEGIELHWRGDGARFRQTYNIPADEPILLYVGRADFGKNVPLLLAYFREWKAQTGRPLRFVRLGADPMPMPNALRDWVLDVGFADAQTKHDAYAAATVFCTMSTIESFSIVIMESWLQATPIIVNAECSVTTDFALRSNGGLPVRGFTEWSASLSRLLDDQSLRQAMGQSGQAFVLEACHWDGVAQRTVQALKGQDRR